MKNRTLLIAGGVALAVLVLWYLLLFRSQSSSLDAAQERRDAAQATNDELQLRLSRLQAAQAREPELTARLETLRVAIPDDPALGQFIIDANDAAQTSGVEFLSISPTPPETNPTLGLSVVNLAIEVTGGYFQTLDYLNRLTALPRIVVVDNLNLTPGAEGDSLLTVSLSARMFTSQVDPVAGDPAAADPNATTTTTAPGATTTTTVAP